MGPEAAGTVRRKPDLLLLLTCSSLCFVFSSITETAQVLQETGQRSPAGQQSREKLLVPGLE